MADTQEARAGQNKHVIAVPIADPVRRIIARDAGDKADVVVDIVEGMVPALTADNIYSELVAALTPVIDQRARSLVGRMLAYKRKPCRAGDACRARDCIYLHGQEQDGAKRRRGEENCGVVFNKVNESHHSPGDLHAYAMQFGDVASFKRLNAEKYLAVFASSEAADRLVRSAEPVLGDAGIKKFYNAVENLARADLKGLFDEQSAVVEKMEPSTDPGLLDQLRAVNARIRAHVTRDWREGSGDRDGSIQEQSLYYNCF